MSRLVLFLFVAVCVVAVQMAPQASYARYIVDDDDEGIQSSLDNVEVIPVYIIKGLKKQNAATYSVDDDERMKIPWGKAWEIGGPLIKDAGIAAGKELIHGIQGKLNH